MKTLFKSEMFKKDQASSAQHLLRAAKLIPASRNHSWPTFVPNETSWRNPTRIGSFSYSILSRTPITSTLSWSFCPEEIS